MENSREVLPGVSKNGGAVGLCGRKMQISPTGEHREMGCGRTVRRKSADKSYRRTSGNEVR